VHLVHEGHEHSVGGRLTTLAERTDLPALLRDVRRGSTDALAALYGEYGAVVYDIARRITGSAADAEDITQDVFIGLPEAAAVFDGRGSFEGWLKKVAVRASLMRLRDRRRIHGLDGDRPPDGRLVADETGAAIDRIAIERALTLLPDELRVVFVLKEIEGYSHREAAALVGITKGASEVRLFRARKALQELIGGRP